MTLEELASRAAQYLLSLPERTVRSLSALAGGLLRELGEVTVPPRLRRTALYNNLVESTLRFLIEQVGQVEGSYPREGKLADDFALRRAAGNGIEAIGIIAFRASPVWVLAALADLSGAGRELVREIAGSLKQEGLLDPGTEFETIDQMLDGLERTSARLAQSINTPPLDVAGLRREWAEVQESMRNVPAPNLGAVRQQWSVLSRCAEEQGRSVFAVSTLMALSSLARLPENVLWLSRCAQQAARHTGKLLADGILEHYARTLDDIRTTGFLEFWTREYKPYLKGAAAQFSPRRRTLTEKLLDPAGRNASAKPRGLC